jgi:signal recognition particle subunit SEC65
MSENIRKQTSDGRLVTKEEYIKKVEEELIKLQLQEAGYDYAVAIATDAEIKAGAACGQLAIIEQTGE